MSCISVQTSNLASKIALNTAFEAGSIAIAASSLGHPIGALGGAIFGAVRYTSQIPLAWLGIKVLNSNNPRADTAAKTLAKALTFFGSFAAAWSVLAAAGFSLSLSHILTITALSMLASEAIKICLMCLQIDFPAQA